MVKISNGIVAAALAVALLTIGGEAFAQQGPPIDGGGAAPVGGGAAGGGAAGGPPPASPFGGPFMFMLLGFFVLMIVMSTMTGRKEKKQMQQMLSSLSRHDKVMTTGGVIGVITDVRDDEVVLKVDESTNTRIRFAKTAVKTVLKHASDRGEASEADVIDEDAEMEDARTLETASAS